MSTEHAGPSFLTMKLHITAVVIWLCNPSWGKDGDLTNTSFQTAIRLPDSLNYILFFFCFLNLAWALCPVEYLQFSCVSVASFSPFLVPYWHSNNDINHRVFNLHGNSFVCIKCLFKMVVRLLQMSCRICPNEWVTMETISFAEISFM